MRSPSPADRARGLRGPALTAAAVLLTGTALHLRDPHVPGSWGFCPWLALTGSYCAGCGGLRAVHDLTDGDPLAAASSNLLLVAALPVLAAWWGRWAADGWRGRTRAADPARDLARLSAAAAAFWVLRNLPGLEWLRP